MIADQRKRDNPPIGDIRPVAPGGGPQPPDGDAPRKIVIDSFDLRRMPVSALARYIARLEDLIPLADPRWAEAARGWHAAACERLGRARAEKALLAAEGERRAEDAERARLAAHRCRRAA